jgi:hypothetical protein
MSECTQNFSGGAEQQLCMFETEISSSRLRISEARDENAREQNATTKLAGGGARSPGAPRIAGDRNGGFGETVLPADNSAQVISRQRVADHGEVFTAEREVNAMLDLVKDETERIDSRFLEPACGTGNFLDAILRRKLAAVERQHKRSRDNFERNGVTAVASLYGIELQRDNVVRCRERLLGVFGEVWRGIFEEDMSERCQRVLRFLLAKNIVWGDALTLRRADGSAAPIEFSEWAPIGGCWMQRRDFTYEELMPGDADNEDGLYAKYSDTGTRAFIPKPLNRNYPKTHYLEVCDGSE